MGWRLVEEILDHCPDMKYREFRVLVALAASSRDKTRLGLPGIDALALKANCGHAAVYRALAGLEAKGLIKRTATAAPGRRQVYLILPTPLSMAIGDDAATPLNSEPTPLNSEANASHHVETPPVSTRHIQPSVPSARAPTAQTILAAFIDWDRGNGGQLTKRTTGQLAKHIAALLAEGIPERHIRQGLADWRAKGMHPAALDSFVNAAMNGHGSQVSRRQAETDAMFSRAMERAQGRRPSIGDRALAEGEALKAQLRGHRELP